MSLRNLIVSVGILLSACGGSGSEKPAVSATLVRDSAGITILESSTPAWLEMEGWTVAPEPSLQIGRGESEGPTAFTAAVSATRRSDGVIVVADALVSELKFFSPTGEWLFTTGGSGQGPGEYRIFNAVTTIHGDSVGVYDLLGRRFTLLGPDGQVGRMISLSYLAGDGVWLWDGSALVQKLPTAPRSANFGPDFVMASWFRVNSDGTDGDSIGAAIAAFAVSDEQNRNVPIFPRPHPSVSIDTSGIWAADPMRNQLTHLTFTGTVDRVIRREWPTVILNPVQGEALIEFFNRGIEEAAAEVRALLPPVVVRDTVPAFRSMKADRVGNLWVQRTKEITDVWDPQEWVAPTVPGSDEWDVFHPEEGWLGSVQMPEGLTIFEIGDDYVLGTWKDALEVDHVRLHTLTKPDR